MAEYTYSLQNDFGGVIDLTCLSVETKSEFGGTPPLNGINLNGDDVIFDFNGTLTAPQQLDLDDVVANHTGTCPESVDTSQEVITYPQAGQTMIWDATAEVWVNQYPDHNILTNLEDDDHTQYVPTNATRGMEADWDAGDIRIRADDGFDTGDAEIDALKYLAITGKLQGGLVSQNAIDDQLLDVTAGTGIVTDMTDLTNPKVKEISWDAFTFDPGLDETLIKWVGLEYNWDTGDTTAVVDVEFTPQEKRSTIVIARVWGTTPGSTEITAVANYATPAYMPGKSIEDLALALGSVNYAGNVFTPSAVDLKLQRSAGKAFRFAANMTNDALNPNMYDSVDENPVNSYFYQRLDDNQTIPYSLIHPNSYEDSTGNIVAVPTDKWTIQRIYYYPVSNVVTLTWGRQLYDTQSLARDGLVIDNDNIYNESLVGAILRGYLIVKEGATDLSDTDKALIVDAYANEAGLVPGFTNHGQLGGLEDDDHTQYHNDTRGDARYYQKAYIEQSENILYTYPPLTPPSYPFNVKTALDYQYQFDADIGYSGRTSPEIALIEDSTNVGDLNVLAGTGYLADGANFTRVYWNDYTIEGAGDLAQGNWYVSVNSFGVVQLGQTLNESYDVIRLGFFFSYGNGLISSVIQCPCYINSAGNRVMNTLMDLGPFIHDDSGQLQVSSNNDLALTATQASVNWGLAHYTLDERDTVDDIGVGDIRNVFKSSDDVWRTDGWFSNPNGGNGIFPADRYNNLTADGSSVIVASFTFTNGSKTITVSGDYTGSIDKDDFIYLSADGASQMAPIEDSTTSIVFSGGTTTITLEENYTGTGGTGNAVLVESLPRIPNGKYAKHIVFRVLDGDMISVYGNEVFDTEDDARAGALPDYPSSVKVYDVWIAYLLATPSLTSWQGNIYDLRPLPFYREGGGGTGGGAVVTVHSGLSGLGADDHLQYLRTDGTRDLTGTQKYFSQPTFTDDLELITKKYVDDKFPVDHTALTNIGTNTHAQIDTHIADTSIHFTEASIDHNAITNTHNLTTNIDHDQITNTHNLTTDIDHDQLTNFLTTEHFPWQDVVDYAVPISAGTEPRFFDGYYEGGVAIGTSWTDMPINAEREKTSDFTHSNVTNNQEVTINTDGKYIVHYRVTMIQTAGSSRNESESRLVIDTGAGYVEVPGSKLEYYNRTTTYGNSAATTFVLDLADGDKLKVQAIKTQGTGATMVYGEDSGLVICNAPAIGAQGPTGDTGAAGTSGTSGTSGSSGTSGATGPPGSGSTVNAEDEGSSVTGTPFDTFNFIGNGVTATQGTGNTVDVTIPGGGNPANPDTSIQFNNGGVFGGSGNLTWDDTDQRVDITGISETTMLSLTSTGYDSTASGGAALYIEVDTEVPAEGLRVYFKRSTPDISGYITYDYDGATPNFRLIDADDDPPYMAFQTIGTGTFDSPQFDNQFGSRGPVAGATTGFKWDVNGTTIAEMDSEFIQIPTGTTANEPTAVNGMMRYDTTTNKARVVQNSIWRDIIAPIKIYEFFADQVDYPRGTDWSVNVGAPASVDSNNSALKVRRFDDTVNEAIGFMITVPDEAVSMQITVKVRAETAPGTAQNVIMQLHGRSIGNNAAVGSWGSVALGTISIPTNENFQYASTTDTLGNWGLTAGVTYQIQLSRQATNGSDTLSGDLALLSLELEFN